MRIFLFLASFLAWSFLPAAGNSTDLTVAQTTAKLKETLSPDQWKVAQEQIASKRESLLNDPFTTKSSIERKLARWIEEQAALGAFEQKVIPTKPVEDRDFWEKRLNNYQNRLDEMETKVSEAEESQKLLQEVYIYEQELVLVGAATMDDAYVLAKFRNGQDDKVTHISFSVELSFPGDIGQIYDRRWKNVRPKVPVNAWETRDIKIPIKEFLPKNLHFRTKSSRDLVTAKVKLENFTLASTKKNAIKRVPGNMMNNMMAARMGMEEASYALSSLEEKDE
ncbi:hypothetical protein [Rubellicoccus peritrichatus]|uniref:DUF4468 domain-containing protein n=1 Tax=Rubellicoccus peritrichatus TaxID=3080537 RepID=A0AAQ3LAZ5_9BACT|nr:hypothetical protein [Puniceicoccus sp. CR14]WOO42515.1 hypothetical protein RZN69_05390 [Puniceicoccus sp. CR14]